MKKLITATEVEASKASGHNVLYIDSNTIVTPAAVDAAREAGIEIKIGTPQPEPSMEDCTTCTAPKTACQTCANAPAAAEKKDCATCSAPKTDCPTCGNAPAAAEKKDCATCSAPKTDCPTCGNAPAAAEAGEANIDLDVVYKVLKVLMDKGLLNGVNPENYPPVKGPVKPYSYQVDVNGMKLVDGATIQYSPLKTDDPANQVSYQEIINANDGCRMNAGIIRVEGCRFGWKTKSQEIYHVVEGTLKVTAGNKEYTANAGDTVFFPEGVQVTFGSPDKMKAFYAAY